MQTGEVLRRVVFNLLDAAKGGRLKKLKEVNKQLTSYKAIKYMEIKKDEFIKTTTMKIKRYEELKNNK